MGETLIKFQVSTIRGSAELDLQIQLRIKDLLPPSLSLTLYLDLYHELLCIRERNF